MAKKKKTGLPARPKTTAYSQSNQGYGTVFSADPQPQSFMWMPPQNDQSVDAYKFHKEKHKFIREKYHRKRKVQKTEDLKDTIQKSPSGHPDDKIIVLSKDGTRSPARVASDHAPVLYHSPEPQILDIFPLPGKATKQDWNIYFNHFRLFTSTFIFPFCGADRSVWYYRKAQDHPILIEVLTASGAFTRAAGLMIKGSPPQAAKQCTIDALQLRSQAIISLQRVLDHPTKSSLEIAISVVATLIYLGGFETNDESLEMHMNGLKIIINLLGGLDTLDSETKASLYSADCTRAFANNLNLFFEMSPVWEAQVHTKAAQLITKSLHSTTTHFASNFLNSSWFIDLSPRLKALILSLQWIILNFEGIVHVDSQFNEAKNDYLVITTYRLISLHRDCPITHFENTIRLTMVLYTVTRIWSISPQQCQGFIDNNLQPSIEWSFEDMRSTAPELLFWVLWMGGFASVGLECHSWFVERLVEIAVTRKINSWDQASALLERFFFVHRANGEPGRAFWGSIMS